MLNICLLHDNLSPRYLKDKFEGGEFCRNLIWKLINNPF